MRIAPGGFALRLFFSTTSIDNAAERELRAVAVLAEEY
jgi:hypothetical protein